MDEITFRYSYTNSDGDHWTRWETYPAHEVERMCKASVKKKSWFENLTVDQKFFIIFATVIFTGLCILGAVDECQILVYVVKSLLSR
jgi:hypothetical protein